MTNSFGLMDINNRVLVRKNGTFGWVPFMELLESHVGNRIELVEYQTRTGAEKGARIYGGKVVAA